MAFTEENGKMHKKNNNEHHKVVNNLKPGWVAPDGGWGWIIVIASGFSNVFAAAVMVCFGLIFRERFNDYGISTSQTTTIVNLNAAVASFVGLTIGPLFRKYTFRQVGCVAGIVCSAAILSLAFTTTFHGVLFFYSILYASAKSVLLSVNALSVIPYFTKKRRKAVGLSWAVSGLGNITGPQIATLLKSTYGAFGAIILFGGLTLHTVVCSVLMQPVQMNAKRSVDYEKIKTGIEKHDEKPSSVIINRYRIIPSTENVKSRSQYCDEVKKHSSKHFDNKNREENELETPLMAYTEKNRIMKLITSRDIMETDSNQPVTIVSQRKSSSNESNREQSIENLNRQGIDDNSRTRKIIDIDRKVQVKKVNVTENTYGIKSQDKSYVNVHDNKEKVEYLMEEGLTVFRQDTAEQRKNSLPSWSHVFRTVVAFFDLDLLRDLACVNIMIGVSLVIIIEVNFIILTPYILADYGLTGSQTANMLSIAGIIDVLTRLTISMVASRIGWENRTFLFIGVGLSALGHVALAHIKTYNMIFGIAIISAMGKGISIVFSSLILPDYVPLEKLPAATGLQLLIRGILYLAIGPVIGIIRETSGSYMLPLHFLNIFSYYVIISGLIAKCCCSSKRQ